MKLRDLVLRSFFVLILFTNTNLKAQKQTGTSSFLERTDFKIGYFGNLLVNHGANTGVEYLWKGKTKEKRQKTIHHHLLLHGSIGYTTNFFMETENGLSTYFGGILRRVNSKGRLLNLELNPIGYYRSLLPKTYKVDGNQVSKVRMAGRGYYAPSIAFGIGKYRKGKTRTGWYLNLRYFIRTPFNGNTFKMIELEYGHRFNFKKK